MAERIRTSTRAEDTLRDVRTLTGTEYATLARIALAWSLREHGSEVPVSRDDTGREIRYQSLFGDGATIFRAALSLVYGRPMSMDSEEFARAVKNHVDAGCAYLATLYEQSEGDPLTFWHLVCEAVPLSPTPDLDVAPLDIVTGRDVRTDEPVEIRLNDTKQHANPHLAVVGTSGVGKTQFLMHLLARIREVSDRNTHFLFFDYKGDVAGDGRFVDMCGATVYRLPDVPVPINPFDVSDYDDATVRWHAEAMAETFSSVESRIGPVQRRTLGKAIVQAYAARMHSSHRAPDLLEVWKSLQSMYEEEGCKDDSLTETVRRLAEFGLFWTRDSEHAPLESLLSTTTIIDLHRLDMLRELVAFLVIGQLYREMSKSEDAAVLEDRRAIRTILVLDEAHNYLKCRNVALQRIIREGRSKGVAVFLASQSLDDFDQKDFDFRELMEFVVAFKCNAISGSAVQKLLGCRPAQASELASRIMRLFPLEAVTNMTPAGDYNQVRITPFYEMAD